MKTTPILDYMFCKEVRPDTAAVSGADVQDHWQHYEVIAVGEGRHEHGVLIKPSVEVGDIIYVQKHSEADTPKELKDKGYALIMASRVMAKETK